MTPEPSRIYTGDCLTVMSQWPENFVDTIITDPPYGLEFMGKDWDGDVPGVHFWTEMLRIAKPGSMLLAFGGTRTWHHLAMAIEKAGWQIRDCLMWLYGSGFPKSHNLHGEFEGYGTALKPAWEPIILAMKPLDGTFAENAERWGVAGLNVDGGRIRVADEEPNKRRATGEQGGASSMFGVGNSLRAETLNQGRWPANLLLDEAAAGMLDGASGAIKPHGEPANTSSFGGSFGNGSKAHSLNQFTGSGGASRFFYVAKSSRAERNEGCEAGNGHPTVKPLELMKYLCQLTRTPAGGIVLDPFAGSGTTLWAAEFHNRPWLGIEMNPEYVAIAQARIARERRQMKMAV